MAPLARRILIGRRSGNHVVINDRAVSMIHAWIDKRGEECVLRDFAYAAPIVPARATADSIAIDSIA